LKDMGIEEEYKNTSIETLQMDPVLMEILCNNNCRTLWDLIHLGDRLLGAYQRIHGIRGEALSDLKRQQLALLFRIRDERKRSIKAVDAEAIRSDEELARKKAHNEFRKNMEKLKGGVDYILMTNTITDWRHLWWYVFAMREGYPLEYPVLVKSKIYDGYLVIDGTHRLVASCAVGVNLTNIVICEDSDRDKLVKMQDEGKVSQGGLVLENYIDREIRLGELVALAEKEYARTAKNLYDYMFEIEDEICSFFE